MVQTVFATSWVAMTQVDKFGERIESRSMTSTPELTICQTEAETMLNSDRNTFLTGGAGSGKSFLVRHFLAGKNTKEFPVLASTGAAAVLVGGRTFHSFFGLGIMEGGV